jgi:hypothetical protein
MRRRACQPGSGSRSVASVLLEVGVVNLTRSEIFRRARYTSIITAQMRKYFRDRDMRELVKALALPGGCLPLRGVSDEEFFSQHQRTALARQLLEYRFKGVAQVVHALGVFKKNGITGDLSSRANRSSLGRLLRNYDRACFNVAGVWVEFRVKGRGNTRRFVSQLSARPRLLALFIDSFTLPSLTCNFLNLSHLYDRFLLVR